MADRQTEGAHAHAGKAAAQQEYPAVLLQDDFISDLPAGSVIGSLAGSEQPRLGIDIERVISIDNGALRIAPLVKDGFGRAALAYGPFAGRPGLAFAVYMLNGHNTAQAEPLPETFLQRMLRWLKGSETEPKTVRLLRWLRSAHVRRALRQFRRWSNNVKGLRPHRLLDENLAVGWFPETTTQDPISEGHAFIMHALGAENGELWAGGPGDRTRAVRGVQNIPVYFVSVMRPGSIVYYVASANAAVGMSAYPWLQPIAIETIAGQENLYAGIQQGVLGQIGWRMDTRINGVRVAELPGYELWCGGAHAADRLDGRQLVAGEHAEVSGPWQTVSCAAPAAGLPAQEKLSCAVLEPGAMSSLVRVLVKKTADASAVAGLVWRFLDEQNHWRLVLTQAGCELVVVVAGRQETVAKAARQGSDREAFQLQILDQGERFMAYVDGQPIAGPWFTDTRLASASKVGVVWAMSENTRDCFGAFEAHPAKTRLPELLDMGEPWCRSGSSVVICDDFAGAPSDLHGRETPVGQNRWQRIIGTGAFVLSGDGSARVQASQQQPGPDRTAYCLDWAHPDFVDIAATITPPGTAMGQRHRITTGFILYQDPDNYVLINAWRSDAYGGGSISTFFRFGGYEDLYDAIWTNVADRVYFGKPFRLRVACDGEQYRVTVNDEAVLYRAFRDVYPDSERLHINRVGLVSNWEFGTDTGSKLEDLSISI